MKTSKLVREAVRLAEPYCVTNGSKFRMKRYHPDETAGVKSKKDAAKLLEESSAAVSDMQEPL